MLAIPKRRQHDEWFKKEKKIYTMNKERRKGEEKSELIALD